MSTVAPTGTKQVGSTLLYTKHLVKPTDARVHPRQHANAHDASGLADHRMQRYRLI